MYYKVLSSTGLIMMVAGFILALGGRASDDISVTLLAILLIFLSPLVMWLADRVRRKENEKNPVTEVEATVVGHRMETYHGRYSSSHTFHMTFKPVDDGESLEFEVPESDYQRFGTGDKGPLRYRTWEYLSFCAKDMSEMEPIAPLPEEYEPTLTENSVEDGWEKAEKLLDLLTEKATTLWQKTKAQFSKTVKAESGEKATDEDDGVLTHELDE